MWLINFIEKVFINKKNKYFSMRNNQWGINQWNNMITFSNWTELWKTKKIDERKTEKPVNLYNNIIKEDVPIIDLYDLDKKIKIVIDRISILSEHIEEKYLIDEHNSLFYLRNRKEYEKNKDSFLYPITTDELIEKLCNEYKLKLVDFKMYFGTVPVEWLEEIKKYTKIYKKITGINPLFKLIVEDSEIIEKKKKDPILLVNSPFWNWFYILWAWDKEVLVVDDLIYNLK